MARTIRKRSGQTEWEREQKRRSNASPAVTVYKRYAISDKWRVRERNRDELQTARPLASYRLSLPSTPLTYHRDSARRMAAVLENVSVAIAKNEGAEGEGNTTRDGKYENP